MGFGILLDWEYGLARDSELNLLVEIPEPEMPEGAVAGEAVQAFRSRCSC